MLVERVGGGAGVEIAAAAAGGEVEVVFRIGPARSEEELDDLALHVKQLIELHLLPILETSAGGGGVEAAEGDVGVANGFEDDALDGRAIGMKNLNSRIDGRAAARGEGFDDVALIFLRFEAIEIDVD